MRPAILALCAACAADPAPADTDTVDVLTRLDAPGPFRAGYRVGELRHDDGVDGATRTLRRVLWYPTDDQDGPDAAYLFDARPAPGVLRDATPAPGPHGLVVFSHGAQSYAETSGALMAHLATHGWIVAAVDHLPDVTYRFDGRSNPIYLDRPRDITALLDALLDGSEPGLEVDPARIAGIGHSFGGYTMLVVAGAVWDMDTWAPACTGGASDTFCQDWDPAREAAFRAGAADPRLRTVILMNAGDHRLFGPPGLATVDRAALQITGALDSSVPNDPVGDALWRDLPDGVRVDMAHGDHVSLTDFAGDIVLPGTSPDALEPARAGRIGRVLLTGWLAARIDDDEDAAAVFDADPFDDDLTVSRR